MGVGTSSRSVSNRACTVLNKHLILLISAILTRVVGSLETSGEKETSSLAIGAKAKQLVRMITWM